MVPRSGGPRDTADSRLHRLKGPPRLEAWRSGAKMAITLETKPGTKPETNKRETKLPTWQPLLGPRIQQPGCPALSKSNLHRDHRFCDDSSPRRDGRGVVLGAGGRQVGWLGGCGARGLDEPPLGDRA